MRLFAPIAVASSFLLSSCIELNTVPNQGPCPAAGSIYDTARVVGLDGNGESFDNITFTGEIVDVRLFCRYVDDEPISAEIEVDFAFGKGPAAVDDSNIYGYYVAVTRTNRAVIAKETFSVEAVFENGETVSGAREVIADIEIPRADSSISGANFEVLVGFELTDEQLNFNREGKRFRLDAGQ